MYRLLKLCVGLWVGVFLFLAQAQAQVALAQKPLFLSAGAEPNVMFILDDSYSMQDEIMPEDIIVPDTGNTVYSVFPQPSKVYNLPGATTGSANPQNRVATPGSIHWMVTHSSNNTIYYDPSIRYTPWVKSDGTYYNNASPTCAPHYPEWSSGARTNSQANCRNLTVAVASNTTYDGQTPTWVNCSSATATPCTGTTGGYFPAAYYPFTGNSALPADVWNTAKYGAEVQIIPATTSYPKGANRTDCMGATCTYTEEIQNFANWYTYYRSRLLLAKAAVGKAFVAQTDAMRVGFSLIGKSSSTIDGVAQKVVVKGVRSFTPTAKANFYTELYGAPADTYNTPLRNALNEVGKYFSRSDAQSPWADNPATGLDKNGVTQTASTVAACRQSYSILMTDGYWNDDGQNGRPAPPTGIGNQDNTAGSTITNDNSNPTPANYTFAVNTSPFSDAFSNTLADVAMKYWKTDLRTDINNKLKPTAVDPAFWQHMSTYTIGLGVFGTLGNIDVENAITRSTSIPWVDAVPGIDNAPKIDDLLHAAINGHGDFFSAKDPAELSQNLGGMLSNVIKRETNNAAAAAANSTSLNNNSIIYQAIFSTVDWSGQLTATSLSALGVLSATPNWSASIPAAASRNLYSYNDVTRAGISLTLGNLSASQITALGSSGASTAQQRLDWLTGVNLSTSAAVTADLRIRTNLLGDIVNSDPAFSGTNDLRFENLTGALGANTYHSWYILKKKNRREMLFVGANDGMLHAFNAHPFVSGDTLPSKTAGQEMFAYVPSQVFSKVKALASLSYGTAQPHQYSVDGPSDVRDAYFNNAWHTLLVGTLGAGGRGIFVLDITDPDNFTASNVLFELTDAQYPELGNIMGLAIIAPGKDGRWKIFVGNGYNSSQSGVDRAYLGVIDIESEVNKAVGAANKTVFISTTVATAKNGLSQPELLPDGDGTIKAAYAGDLLGNMWKFDLSSTSPASWNVAYSAPLFIAKDSSSVAQPITSSPSLGINTLLTPTAVMVYFGTGQYLVDTDKNTGTATQTFYAIADKGAAITSTDRTTLHTKTLSTSGNSRTISGETTGTAPSLVNAVTWTAVDGWYLDFSVGERVITKPLLLFDRLIFPTLIPSSDACTSGGTGWMMELKGVGAGADLNYSLLTNKANSFLDVPIIGGFTSLGGGLKPTPSSSASSSSSSADPCASSQTGTIAIVGTNTEGKANIPTGCTPTKVLGRQSWRELH